MDTDTFLQLLKENQESFLIPGELLNKGGPKDYVGMTVAMTGTLFFRDSYRPEVRRALFECFQEWEALARPHLKWLWVEGLQGPVRYDRAPPLDLLLNEEPALSLGYYAGEQPHDASQWHFMVLGKADWEAKLGRGPDVVRFSMPFLYAQEHPRAFQQLFVSFARRLKAIHGLGGFGFVLSPTRESKNHPAEAAFSVKMHGAEAGNPFGMTRYADAGIKSVSWLTALGTELLEKLDGVDGIRGDLPPLWYAYYDYGAGVVIQAGNEPDIGPADDDTLPVLYVLANAALRSVRAPEIGAFHQQLDGGRFTLASQETARWLRRFDTEDLAEYQARLQQVPKLKAAHRL
ncbi:DUF3396 domain-containing protein [Luteimonas sp. SJ-92]|uniref:DUF3396 domain-containing protein n=1 Tax=Luteimonas salinisoli TaxID=2752307 RepID=A0A853JDL3_9GAMM|nr:type VI immunity family protein [Luteimonas salinisoli]NZA26834.1 DUF3396 domain-containing protein [Luteimonas salinisoli]